MKNKPNRAFKDSRIAVGAENVYRWNALARHHGVQAVREDMGLDGVQRFVITLAYNRQVPFVIQ